MVTAVDISVIWLRPGPTRSLIPPERADAYKKVLRKITPKLVVILMGNTRNLVRNPESKPCAPQIKDSFQIEQKLTKS